VRPRSAPLGPPTSAVAETFVDGPALFDAVCRLGLEAWSRSAYRAATARISAAGSRRRIRTTGVATPEREAMRHARGRGARTHV
jgi:hypothetical protein